MTHTRIKICGITRTQDALCCEAVGADAIGFVFVDKSKRRVDIATAQAISNQLGPFITRVGLFLDPEPELVHSVLAALPDLMPQFHGRESDAFCDGLNRPYLKTIAVGSGMPGEAELNCFTHAAGFLYDSNASGELGGTGHTFDWDLLVNVSDKPLILAGGLDPDNIERAISTVRPYAVDVSTGVEQSPGIKDAATIEKFVSRIRGVTQ